MRNMNGEFPVNAIRLCIDSAVDGISGRIYAVALKSKLHFGNLQELVVQIDEAYNSIGQPQPNRVMRSFRKDAVSYNSYKGAPRRYYSSMEVGCHRGNIRTYDLIMISRIQSEWQGILKRTDGSTVGVFNSMLEFLKLMKNNKMDKE